VKWLMLLIFTAALSTRALSQEVIAKDSLGLEVVLKEKYGDYVTDTATVVFAKTGCFVLAHKDRFASWFPMVNWGLVYVSRLTKGADDEKDN